MTQNTSNQWPMNTQICTPFLSVRITREPTDIRAALACRSQAFGRTKTAEVGEGDQFDNQWHHILVEDIKTGRVLGCARVMNYATGSGLHLGYSAQFYDLSRLFSLGQPVLELGRFCVLPGKQSADVIRLIWAAVTRLTDHHHSKMLVGCSSFQGIDPILHLDAFGLLGAKHLAPDNWAPLIKSGDIFQLPKSKPDAQARIRALHQMPTLVRSYLAMGGWVSDHGVIDRDMSTIHVFTGLEVAKIPARRAARLRSLAA